MKQAPALAPGPCVRETSALLFKRANRDLADKAKAWLRKPSDAEALHEFRNSVRRLRSLERLFPGKSARSGRTRLRKAGDVLGFIRDLDVIISLAAESPHAELIRAFAGIRRQQAIDRARRYFRSIGAGSLMLHPPAMKVDGSTGAYFNQRFEAYVERVKRSRKWAASRRPDRLHRLRIRLRRIRYLMMIMGSLASREQVQLATRFRACEKRLGQVHDLDMALELLKICPGRSERLEAIWVRARKRRLDQFRTAWRKTGKKWAD